jgi:hypothetical protein
MKDSRRSTPSAKEGPSIFRLSLLALTLIAAGVTLMIWDDTPAGAGPKTAVLAVPHH